jgi:hypothetical protein
MLPGSRAQVAPAAVPGRQRVLLRAEHDVGARHDPVHDLAAQRVVRLYPAEPGVGGYRVRLGPSSRPHPGRVAVFRAAILEAARRRVAVDRPAAVH